MLIGRINITKVSTVTPEETISMALKNSGAILKEDCPLKVESERNDCLIEWLNMSGGTIIEMIVLNFKMNSL